MNRTELQAQLQLLASLEEELDPETYRSRKAALEQQLNALDGEIASSTGPHHENRSVIISGDGRQLVIITGDGNTVYQAVENAGGAILLEAYQRHLALECSRLPLGAIDPRFVRPGVDDQLALAELYTDLHVVSPVRSEDEDERRWGLRLARAEGEERIPLLEAIVEPEARRVVLLGDAGSGKTTFVNYLSHSLAAAEPAYRDALPEVLRNLAPVRLILRNLVRRIPEHGEQGEAEWIWQALQDDLNERLGELAGTRLFPHWQPRLLQTGGVFLLDGLDEVPAAAERRRCLVSSIQRWLDSLPATARVIVTARPYAYADPAWQLPGFRVLALAPFNRAQIDTFIRHWCAAVRPAMGWDAGTADDRARSLGAALAQRADLADLASRPLLLTLMAALHSSWGKLPDDRADLLEESVKLLLSRWQQHRQIRDDHGRLLTEWGIATDLGLDEAMLRGALEQLARETHGRRGRQSSDHGDEAADIRFDELMAVLAEVAPADINPRVLAAYLEQRTGLLIARREKIVAFPHRLFQEYLTACHLANIEGELPEALKALLAEDATWWREVFLLCVGRMRRSSRRQALDIVNALLPEGPERIKRPTRNHWRFAVIAGEALLELRLQDLSKLSEFEQAVLRRIRDWLRLLLERQELEPRERLRAGDTLGGLRDPRPGVGVIVRSNRDPVPDINWVYVPSGRFIMGEDDEAHPLDLPAFRIARYPITNAQFKPFVDAGGYDDRRWWTEEGWTWRQGGEPDLSGISDDDFRRQYGDFLSRRPLAKRHQPYFWDDRRWSTPNRPVVGVNWYEALAYARWLDDLLRRVDGKLSKHFANDCRVMLPSEAQWAKAARGRKGYRWPWGDDWQADHANTGGLDLGETTPVGLFPEGASPYGCRDMAGNVWEWTSSRWGSDLFEPDYRYPYQPDDGREVLSGNDFRVLRGGSWIYTHRDARCAYRIWIRPAFFHGDVGVRLVFSLANAEC